MPCGSGQSARRQAGRWVALGCASLVLCLLEAATPCARLARASEPSPSAPGAGQAPCEELFARPQSDSDASPQLELAACYARAGKTASAWQTYRAAAQAAGRSGDRELETLAQSQVSALESELSYLTLETWKGQQVTVACDGAQVKDGVLGTAMPVDPGPHTISATAIGKRPWSMRVMVGAAGDHEVVSIPVLPDAPVGGELPRPASSTLDPSAAELEPSSGGAGVQRTLALIAGAVGIAGVATGTVFGLKAASDWNEVTASCNPYPYCGENGSRLAQEAQQSAMISNIGLVAGVVGLTTGAVLWFTAPSEEKATSIGVGVGRVTLRGPL